MVTFDNYWVGIMLVSSIVTALSIYLSSYRRRGISKKMSEKERPLPMDDGWLFNHKVVKSDIEGLRVINLEKEIVSYALTHLYEAEAEGKITKAERIRLVDKYKAEMQRLKEQMDESENRSGLKDLPEVNREEGLRAVQADVGVPHKTKAQENVDSVREEILKILARIEELEIEE